MSEEKRKKALIGFLKETLSRIEQDRVQVEYDIHTMVGDPRATATLRIIKKKVSPKRSDAVGVTIVKCSNCDGKGGSCCDNFGWYITDVFENGAVDYTRELVSF